MSLKDVWTNKIDGVDDILADDINAIANEAIGNSSKMKSLQENKADKATTLSGYGITDAATTSQLEEVVGLASVAYDKSFKNQQDIRLLQTKKADKSTTLSGYGITDAYTKTETDDAVSGKVDKPRIYTTSSEHISFEFSEYYNWEMRADEARTISFTFGNGSYENDYTSGLSFDSGEVPTAIDYTDSGILNWVGTDCVTTEGLSIFQPSPNTHYDIVFYFNGRQFIGLVNGFVPATGNEAV